MEFDVCNCDGTWQICCHSWIKGMKLEKYPSHGEKINRNSSSGIPEVGTSYFFSSADFRKITNGIS